MLRKGEFIVIDAEYYERVRASPSISTVGLDVKKFEYDKKPLSDLNVGTLPEKPTFDYANLKSAAHKLEAFKRAKMRPNTSPDTTNIMSDVISGGGDNDIVRRIMEVNGIGEAEALRYLDSL